MENLSSNFWIIPLYLLSNLSFLFNLVCTPCTPLLEAIQRQVKIGDTVNVKTNKCCSVDEGMSGKSGVWRKGTVIGIFRNFVHVRLQSGVCESVLWADITNSNTEDDDEEE